MALFSSASQKQIRVLEDDETGEIRLYEGMRPFFWDIAEGTVCKISIEYRGGADHFTLMYLFEHGGDTWLGEAKGVINRFNSSIREWAKCFYFDGQSRSGGGYAQCKVAFNRLYPPANALYSLMRPVKT